MKDLNIFMSLFKGRTDCLGMNQICLKEKLTEDHYRRHVEGFQRIGVYPIVDKEWTTWIACDIDDGDFEKARNIQSRAKHFGLESYIERSKSKGFHVWTFFDEKVKAVKVRLVFEMILEECEFVCELFPKQDLVEDGKYGNFIFLPLFGGNVRQDKTVFVDDVNKIIISQVSELNKIFINKSKILDSIIDENELVRKEDYTSSSPANNASFKPLIKPKPCIEKMKDVGVRAGQRNAASFRLAIYYKQMNLDIDEVINLVSTWNKHNTKPLSLSEIKTTVDSVFKNNYKAFSCEEPTLIEFCDKENCPIIKSHDIKKNIAEGIITMTFRNPEVMLFRKKDYEYRFSNFEFTKSGKFKSSLTLSKDKRMIHRDFINLGMSSNRKRFVDASEDKEVDSDLVKLEDLIRQQIEKETKEKILESKQPYIMTELEKEEGLKFLKNTHNVLSEVIKVTNDMGVVGEETLRLMIYLCFTSRITSEPLSVTVKGESSSGKSFACQNIQKLIPEEGYHFVTRATQNAFYHMAEDGMQHRIIYINELPGSESADYSIRTAQSEGDLILMMPIKDPATGNMETITKKVRGPVGFMITTTQAKGHNENETRNFSIFSDDSPKLTKRIGDITTRKALGEEFKIEENRINLWKNIQRLLNPDFKVIIPYAREVFASFPDSPVRIRRDRERFRCLIEIITILHQYHREQKKHEKSGRTMLLSTLADYHIAKEIAGDVLTWTIFELSPSAEEIWQKILEMNEGHSSMSASEGEPGAEFSFQYKDLAEAMNWKVPKVKKWIYSLIGSSMIEYAEGGAGGRGKASTFRIAKINKNFSSQALGFLPEVRTIFKDHECDKELFYNPFTGEPVDVMNAEAPAGLIPSGIKEEIEWEE